MLILNNSLVMNEHFYNKKITPLDQHLISLQYTKKKVRHAVHENKGINYQEDVELNSPKQHW